MSTKVSVDRILRLALAASDGGAHYVPTSMARMSTPWRVRAVVTAGQYPMSYEQSRQNEALEIAAEEVDHNLVDEIIRYVISLRSKVGFIGQLREAIRKDEVTDGDIGLVASAVAVWVRAHPGRADLPASA